jgi:hypothetical protein
MPQRHTCIVGGARSGKTFALTYAMMYRAVNFPGSRHAIFRLTGNSIRHAITRDTLPSVHSLTCPDIPMRINWQDGFAEFPRERSLADQRPFP